MRLHQRVLLSFIAVILLEGLLSGIAIAVVLGGLQDGDAKRELKLEAAKAYDSFNAWKRALWKLVNELPEDPELACLAAASLPGGRGADLSPDLAAGRAEAAFRGMLGRRLSNSGVDSCILRPAGAPPGAIFALRVSENGQVLPEPSLLAFRRGHPFVDMVASPSGLWFSGATRIGGERGLELYLLKAIDPEFLAQLGHDPRVRVLVSAGEKAVAPLDAEPSRVEAFLAFLAPSRPESGYSLYERCPGFDGEAGAVVQSSGLYASQGGGGILRLSTVLSLEEYRARLRAINGAVALLSLLVAALTLALSLRLAGSVARPVRALLGAMTRLREGEAGVEVLPSRIAELGELQSGFNEMTRALDADNEAIGAYIEEIVGLKEYNERIIDSIREGLAVVDEEGRIERANASLIGLLGLSSRAEAEGRKLGELEPAIFDDSLLSIIRGQGEAGTRGLALRRLGGRTYEVKGSGIPADAARPGDPPRGEHSRHIVLVDEVSERLRYEERMLQAEKLSSIGLLSAGVAHEINNPLGSILSNVQNLIDEEGDPDRARILGIIEGETKRIARIVRELLAFASPHAPAGPDSPAGCPGPSSSPNAVAAEIAGLVGYSLKGGSGLRIACRLDPACPEAAMSSDELKQVLLNLLKNGLQAAGPAGEVRLSTEAEEGWVLISVEDTGPGIAPEHLPRICDPFFTTKSEEDGMGLGLSVVYGIVTKRGGSLRAENREGGGARVSFRIPSARPAAEPSAPPAAEPARDPAPGRAGGEA